MATSAVQLDTSVTEEKILAAIERIVAAANPLRIIAFGSRARGDFRPSSDLDLAVIVDHLDPGEKPPVSRSTLGGIIMSIDLLVFDLARHEHMRRMLGSVNDEIDLHGIVLYNREDAERTDRTAVARLVWTMRPFSDFLCLIASSASTPAGRREASQDADPRKPSSPQVHARH